LTARKRRPGAVLILGAVLLGIGAAALGLRTFALERAEASFRFHQAEVGEADREGPTRTGARGPIEGPEEAGSAWELLRPAFEGVWALADPPQEGSLALNSEPNFTAHGAAGDTPVLLERAAPYLEACRRSLRRSIADGPGPVDAHLVVHQAARVCRALCSKGFLAWQDGRDAEAADWLIAALSVAQDVARLGHPYGNGMLRITEAWVSEEAKFLFSEHGLTEPQLREFERRLDVLRATRPLPTSTVWGWGADARSDVLEGRASVDVPDKSGDAWSVPLEQAVGWRDLWSVRLQKARVLAELRDAALQSESLPWNSSGDLASAWASLCARYRQADVGQLWGRRYHFGIELAAALRRDFLRAAAAVARFEAAHGRMPRDLAETGGPVKPSRTVTIQGDRIVVDLPTQAADYGLYDTLAPVELNWEIRRR